MNSTTRTKTRTQRRTILVNVRRDVLELVASHPRFDVIGQADSGREAMSLVKRQKPELVLIDFDTPDMSVFELVRRLKAVRRVPRVVVLLAHELPRLHAAVLRSGADYCVSKSEIGEHLSRLCGRARRKHDFRRPTTKFWGTVAAAAIIVIALAAVIGSGFTSWHYWNEEQRTELRERQQVQQHAWDHWEKEIAKAQSQQQRHQEPRQPAATPRRVPEHVSPALLAVTLPRDGERE